MFLTNVRRRPTPDEPRLYIPVTGVQAVGPEVFEIVYSRFVGPKLRTVHRRLWRYPSGRLRVTSVV